MVIETYEFEDLRDAPEGADHRYEFIADLPGDNPDIFRDMDNQQALVRLNERGVLDNEMRPEVEVACFYIYFTTQEAGRRFISKLNGYIINKAKKLEEASEF